MQHLELWVALARSKSWQTACRLLNYARRYDPSDPAVWIAAAKLKEAQGNLDTVRSIIDRGIKYLAAQGVIMDQDFWLKVCIFLLAAARCHYPAGCHLSGWHLDSDVGQLLAVL